MSCTLREPYPNQDKARDHAIYWYRFAGRFHEEIGDRGMTILFSELKSGKVDVRSSVEEFLGITLTGSKPEQNQKHRSKHDYPKDLGIDENVFDEELGSYFDKHMPSWKEELLSRTYT
jgi:hypothetical protein